MAGVGTLLVGNCETGQGSHGLFNDQNVLWVKVRTIRVNSTSRSNASLGNDIVKMG